MRGKCDENQRKCLENIKKERGKGRVLLPVEKVVAKSLSVFFLHPPQ